MEKQPILRCLLQRRTIVCQQILDFLDETTTPTPTSEESRNRRQKRFLKTSTFWEEDCKHMYDDKFVDFYRISKTGFGEILDRVYPSLLTSSAAGDSIEPEKKLALALRYLATGDDFTTLAHLFRVGKSTVRTIIADVTSVTCINSTQKAIRSIIQNN